MQVTRALGNILLKLIMAGVLYRWMDLDKNCNAIY